MNQSTPREISGTACSTSLVSEVGHSSSHASEKSTAEPRDGAGPVCPEELWRGASSPLIPETEETVWLSRISSPADVRAMPAEALPCLAREIRERMVSVVSRTGGHLAPSLGVVELTIALCRVFDFPADKVVWDVGHQTYAWKMLTGRDNRMGTLRQFGGLRGFTSPEESPYDATVAGHAGVALSSALGMAAARDARGGAEHIVAVVGDASLTNGISLEAVNAVRHTTERLILVINDNGMSISRNVGAFARLFARRLAGLRYNRIRAAAEAAGHRLRLSRLKAFYRGLKGALKPLLLRQRSAVFEELGFRYIGPIDGHDIPALCDALRAAAEGHVPVALHIATVKGKGYPPAERNPSKWHGVAPWHRPVFPSAAKGDHAAQPAESFSEAFGEALCALAERDPRVVAVTAAMRDGTGLAEFFRRFPGRAYDVGICEEHAVVFAAGLAAAGLRPFVAVYSTFAQRAVDCLMHDVCLPRLPVVLCLDRAGAVGADGPTHHGLYDLAMCRALPGLTVRAPLGRESLKTALAEALASDGPTLIRYPRGAVPAVEPPPASAVPSGEGPVLVALGHAAVWAAPVAEALGMPLLAVDAVKPLPPVAVALGGRPVVTLEDAAAQGGFGSAVAEIHRGPLLTLGWPDRFVPQGTDDELRAWGSLDTESLVRRIRAWREECRV